MTTAILERQLIMPPTTIPPVNVMLDIETYGLSPGSVIKTIGAVKFATVDGKPTILDKFYRRIDAQSGMLAGLTMDAPTVEWWMQQSDEARREMTMPGEHLSSGLGALALWMGQDCEVWGNGAAYDNVLVAEAHIRALGSLPLWAHRRSLCYRTIKNANRDLPIDAYRVRTHHNALDDAESQALHLMAIWERDAKRKKALMLLTQMVASGIRGENAALWETAQDLVNDMPTPSEEWKAEVPE